MAEGVAAIANVQLTVLQAPEIARAQVPIAAQAQIANAQAPAIIAKQDQDALETVQQLQQADRHSVPDTLDGRPGGELPTYRERPARSRSIANLAVPLAAAHPRGLGALVDVRA